MLLRLIPPLSLRVTTCLYFDCMDPELNDLQGVVLELLDVHLQHPFILQGNSLHSHIQLTFYFLEEILSSCHVTLVSFVLWCLVIHLKIHWPWVNSSSLPTNPLAQESIVYPVVWLPRWSNCILLNFTESLPSVKFFHPILSCSSHRHRRWFARVTLDHNRHPLRYRHLKIVKVR